MPAHSSAAWVQQGFVAEAAILHRQGKAGEHPLQHGGLVRQARIVQSRAAPRNGAVYLRWKLRWPAPADLAPGQWCWIPGWPAE